MPLATDLMALPGDVRQLLLPGSYWPSAGPHDRDKPIRPPLGGTDESANLAYTE